MVTVPSSTRFFVVALDDPNQSSYQNFDPNITANIPIYTKGNELANIIWKIKSITGAPRVIVVAHSMGGLDARAYIEGLASPTGSSYAAVQYFNDIAALITLDTPHGGAATSAWDSAGLLAVWLNASCASSPSIDKSEMLPSGTDWITGTESVMPQLNYQTSGATPLPPALTINSIASYWYNPGSFFLPLDELTDDILGVATQDLESSLSSPGNNSASLLKSTANQFASGQSCFPLHFLTCTGSASQTLGYLEGAVFPLSIMTSGQLQISPATPTVGSGKTVSFSEMTGAPIIWSILEGAIGGSIDPVYGYYQAPANHTTTTETFHIVAINSQNPSQYASMPIQVTSSVTKTATNTVLTPSSSQVPIGANLTISATVQASGGTPTGTVTFYDGTRSLGPEVLNNAGVATYSTSSLSLGSHSITAQYGGDSNYTASASSAITIAIVAIAPQLSVSPTSGTLGVTSFVKTDTGFTPNGLITHTATIPGGSLSVLQTYADSNGSYQYNRTYSVAGNYSQIDTDGTSGQTTTPVTWTVSAAVTNDFSLSVSPSSQSVTQGSSVSYNVVTATSSGTGQNIGLSASNLPSGLTASFNPATVASGVQSALTVAASASAPTGTYTLTVTGTGTSTTHTYQITVTVVQAATGPAVTLTPSIVRFNSQAVGSVSSPQTIMLMNSGSGQLKVSSIALLAGSDYVLTLPSPAPPNILNSLVPYNIQVAFAPTTTGTRSGQILVYDNAPGSPHVVSLTGPGTAAQPTSGTINVNATLNGTALPASYGYAYSLTGPTASSGGGAYSYSVSPGSYTIASSGNLSYLTLSSVTPSATQSVVAGGTVTFTLNFTAPNDFYAPSFTSGSGVTPQIVTAGSTANYSIGLGQPAGNASTPITLAVSGVPSNSNPVFNPQPAYSATASALSVGTTSTTPMGTYTLSLSGTNTSGLTRQGATSTLVVTAPPTKAVQLASESSSGAQANAATSTSYDAVSADGRYVVFSTTATNLAAGNTYQYAEIYVRDLKSSTTTPVSVSNSGVLADSYCYGGSISANGRFVVFWSDADNLYKGSVLNGNHGVYVHDLSLGTTEREDIAPDGTPANGSSFGSAISADGRFVAFVSNASNLISGVSGMQAYERDRNTGKIVLVSSAMDGSAAGSESEPLAISADGRFVAFVSNATNLVSQNTNGLDEAFVRDVAAGVTYLVSVSNTGVPANKYVFTNSNLSPLALSADGRFVTFSSMATNLVAEPLDGTIIHVFQYDRQLQQNTLIDVDSVGTPLGGWPSFTAPAVSADGRFITFYGFNQALVRDVVANQTAVVSLASNGSAGNNTTVSSNWNLSLGGSEVVFASGATNLVANDTNGVADAFAAQNPFVGSSSLQSLVLSSSSASGGSTVAGTVTLSSAAPTGGATVTVWSNNAAAQPPAEVVVPAGATSVPVSFSTSLVPSETIMTIMTSYNGGSSVALLTLEPAPVLAVSPTAWDFGYQAVSTSSAAESFALSNSGTTALAINSVQLTSGQVFSISANTCGSSIVAGGSCSISVTFKPSASGSASDAVQISFGSPATIQSISLTGNGATPLAALSPVPLSFGNQAMPGSNTAVATLSNNGNASLTNISASVSGTNAADFAISSDGCSGVILPANSNCLVAIAFTPKAKGSRQATLSIADSATGSPQAISLTGTGVQSTPTVLWNPSVGSLTYGTPLGTGVLDATANQNGSNLAGTFAYTATISGGTPSAVTQATVLGAGAYTLTATFTPTDTTDYATATATTSITVNGIAPTITFTVSNHTYGDAPFTVAATSNSTGAIAYSVVSGPATISGSTVTLTGAGSVIIQASQVAAGNYTAGTQTATVTVAKESQTITFTAPVSPVNYGVAPISLSASASSGLAIAFNVVSGPGTISGSTLTITGAGTVVVAANQAGNANYAAATQVTQNILVNAASQTITFTAPTSPVTYGVSPITLVATGGASGNAVTFSVVSGPGTVSGSTLTITGAGTVVVAANQAGNANYSAATQVTQSITVNQASQTISFTALTSPVTYGVSSITLVASSTSGLAVTFSVISGPGMVSGNTLTITGVGTVVVAANQAGNTNYSAATQATQSIVVNVIGAAATPTFSPVAGTYTAAQTVTISDATSGVTIYYTTNGTTPITSSPVYSGAITVSSTETLEAIATATGYSTSAMATAAYIISIPTNPVPALSGISPAFTNAGGAVFTLTLNGSGFIASSTVYWGTSALTTTYVSATQLTAQVPAADIATAGTVAITVQNPTPGGGTSNAWQFEVDSVSSGSTAPTITSTTETVAAGSAANYPVTVPSSVTSVYVTCLNLPTGANCSYSSTTNTVTITTSSTTPKGTYQITVVFTETVSGAASGFILLPILLLPLGFMRRKLAARGIWLTACLGLVLMATAALSIGCGGDGGGGSSSTTPPATHQVTSSGSVSLTIQ
jgi:hypothetical protein